MTRAQPARRNILNRGLEARVAWSAPGRLGGAGRGACRDGRQERKQEAQEGKRQSEGGTGRENTEEQGHEKGYRLMWC